MSRSKKKTPIIGNTTSKSEKKDKQFANRKYRRIIKEKLNLAKREESSQREEELLPLLREKSDVWSMAKDGKKYKKEINPKYMRK